MLPGGAVVARGFVAAGVECGVRSSGGWDLGLLFSEWECTAAAVYTRNVLQGAPLAVTRRSMEDGGVRAVVVNSGSANAATGQKGLQDAYGMRALAAEALGIEAGEVAVASTGVIGERLPMAEISAGIAEAAAKLDRDGAPFAEAILTTDTRTKEVAVQVEIGGKSVIVGGTAKGSGMIHPNMGTMLAFLTTDAAVEAGCLDEALRAATDRTFNRVSVDGDTSPSDMAVFLANGAAGNEPLGLYSPYYPIVAEAVEVVSCGFVRDIAWDVEVDSLQVEVDVDGNRV